MNKTEEAVKYMIDVWDEVIGKTWRQRPDHVQQKFLEAETEQLRLGAVSKSLPIKKYEIDFDGNVLAGIEISENTPKVFGAMNGYGNGISIENIKITEK